MANNEGDHTAIATGFGEISHDYMAATTPLSDLNGREPSYDVNVEVHSDDDDESEESSDDDDDDEDQVQVQERIVQADGSVVIKIKASSDGSGKHRKKSSKKKPTKAQPATTKLTAIALSAMAAAAASSGTAHAPGAIQTGQWSSGIFDCFDFCMPNCCMASFCPCISAAQIASRVGFKYMSVLIVFGIAVALDLFLYIMTVATINNSDSYRYYSYGYYYYYSRSETKLTAWAYIGMVVSVIIFVAYWQLRTRVRNAFQLPGSPVGDFCLSCFCSCCSLAQMATHVKSYKPGSCDFGAPDELAAYTD